MLTLLAAACGSRSTPSTEPEPANGTFGRPTSAAIGYTGIQRAGELPPPPTVRDLAPWQDTNCGWRGLIDNLEGLGDPELELVGAGKVSPLLFFENGQPLRPHAEYIEIKERCSGAFRHASGVIRFSPSGGDSSVVPSRSYEIRLNPDFPIRDPGAEEAWWVFPGTRATLRFDKAWKNAETFAAQATILAYGGQGGQPSFAVAGQEPASFQGNGSLMQASFSGLPPKGSSWSIEIESPTSGPYLLLRSLTVGKDSDQVQILGKPGPIKGSSLLLVGEARGPVEQTWAAAPPKLSVGKAQKSGTSQLLPIQGLDFLVNTNLKRLSPDYACSPVQLLESGKPSSMDYTSCAKVQGGQDNAWCFGPGGLAFNPPGGKGGSFASSRLGAALDPTRACKGARFLYPGDSLSVRPKKRAFTVGADQLEMSGTWIPESGPDRELTLTLQVGQQVLLQARPLMSSLAQGQVWKLENRIDPSVRDLELKLSSPSDSGYFVISSISLSESRPFESLPLVSSSD